MPASDCAFTAGKANVIAFQNTVLDGDWRLSASSRIPPALKTEKNGAFATPIRHLAI
jgi:hypothetical protein